MPAYLQVFVFVFGTIIGSFLNAVIWRLRTGESVAVGRSYCPHCRHALSAIDLVPILSFLFLKGRCRYCRAAIGISYLVVEAVCGVVFVLFALQAFVGVTYLGPAALASLLLSWYVSAIMIAVFVYDYRYMLIPRSLTLPATVLAAAGNLALGLDPLLLALGVLVGGGFFWIQRVVSRGRWVGGGDVHLGLLMGAALGLPRVLVALFIAYIVGAAIGLVLLARRSKGWKSEIPFGTFLSAAAVVTLLWGDVMVSWYLGLLS